MQHALTVALRPRFLLSQLKEDRFTAGTAYQDTENSKIQDSQCKVLIRNLLHHHILLFTLFFLILIITFSDFNYYFM